MNRIVKAFNDLKNKNEKAFVPYIMAGDGGLEVLEERITFLEKAGATAIELGLPFSDPVADGPVIQAAGLRSLQNGTTVKKVLKTIGEFRSRVNIPIILMTYLNPILAYNLDSFLADCQKVGVDGLIVPDLPNEEEGFVVEAAEKVDIEIIRLVTLTSPIERIEAISKLGNGYLYAVTVTGITGSRAEFQAQLGDHLKQVKQVSKLPVLAGFGISTPAHVQEMTQYCDGVIVGSKIVDLFEKGDLKTIEELIQSSKSIQV
ncbi:tryptophan synthase subunit alpha [Bacillus sp. 03113]|uniref:tryptophan synthase subunit alpha n=1 Tax=Bacillus sp. 03113 TaxID=2578211 RepID=UPI0011439D5F|nr:tryptophan synthase subunit alpha [Bacillus sp. 03113]